MKSCPACKRTYADDTLSFCLEDGSLLSAQYDPDATLEISSRPTDPDSVITRVVSDKSKPTNPNEPQPTMKSPQIPPIYLEKAQYQTGPKKDNKLWVGVAAILVCIGGLAAALIVWSSLKPEREITNVDINLNSNLTSSNQTTQRNNHNDMFFGPLNYNGSLSGENLSYYPGSTPEQCQDDCARTKKCKGFTYIRAGAYNPQDSAMCYQIAVVKEMVSHSCCISAVKR